MKNLKTQTLVFGQKVLEYVGLPLEITVCDKKHHYSGTSNFLASNEKAKTKIDLKDLNDCFYWMSRWSIKEDYVFGYIMDYSTKTIYYDTQEALDHIHKLELQEPDEKEFFKNFIQKDFSSHEPAEEGKSSD